jgi:cytoskeletal protein CcmA (bactofilin family)
VTIGAEAKVKANVEAVDIFLAGELTGNVKATGKLMLKAGARLNGNVETAMLSVEPGAILNGKCTMSGSAQAQEAE